MADSDITPTCPTPPFGASVSTATRFDTEQLLRSIPAAVFTVDATGRFTSFNARAAALWQLCPRPGVPYLEFAQLFRIIGSDGRPLPPDTGPIARALAEGLPMSADSMEIERPDGSRFFARYNVAPIFADDGAIAGAIAVFLDVTTERRAQEASREIEHRYRAVFQQASVGMFECDLQGHIVRTNGALQRLLGYAEAELQRMNWRDLVPSDELGQDDTLADILKRQQTDAIRSERRFQRRDGSQGWVDVFATLIRDGRGAPAYGLTIVVDITERRSAEIELKQREEQLRVVADHASVFLAQVDRNLRYRFVNRAYAARYGREPHEIVGRTVQEIAGDEPNTRAVAEMQRALAGERVEFEMEIPIGGEKRWGNVALVPERDASGNVAGFVAVLVDITARRRAEMELERARDEALAASRAKDDFLAALSHELRTPLSPVLLIASEAVNNPELPAKVRGDFEIVRKSVELEARLIDDLLDLTRIVRNRLVMDARVVDVARVVQDSLATIEIEFRAKSIAVETHYAAEPTTVLGDPVRLQQVFWNVLKNAVKFTPNGGTVSVRTQVDATNRLTIVDVSDSGIGLNSGEIARVFEAFAQGDHASHGGSHRFGGLGLGLAISRRIVQLHGGEISATSPGRDRGSTFRIELPLHTRLPAAGNGQSAAKSIHHAAPLAPLPGPAGAPHRVLLVEDHTPTRTALESLLRRRNLEVRSAGTAAEARALAATEAFELLVSDIGLPDGTGHELMAEFRDRYGLRGIALTGYGMEDDVARSQNAGFSVHLTKPIRIHSLDRALAVVLGQTRTPAV